ncbi:glycosyltransferase [Actinospica robiniae]|uniref:glycosyltransferase n=1 Tax=Actinospica robiniae TaxID=304901 RepID=UPI00041962F8|nr:glycosyltransferase [Actinospica robiniae]
MRILFFGTYDVTAHPRVGVLAEGLRAYGHEVTECNAPLGLDTADRVAILSQPWRLPVLFGRLGSTWLRLARTARRAPKPDAVVVGYMGHFDVRLARLLFRRKTIVLDHLIGASDTARDRNISGGGVKTKLLRAIDAGALKRADVVVVDTEEHLETLPDEHRSRGVVVQVGAPDDWFAAAPAEDADSERALEGPLRVAFFGLYTPLQGAPVIGAALGLLGDVKVEATMIGRGQEFAAARAAAEGGCPVTWIDWVPSTELPALVAEHDVCLGIFGTGPKALRVVPNKVFQGAAAGCAVVTSDTAPQRRALGDAALFVPPGDAEALAAELRGLAGDPARLAAARKQARAAARDRFGCSAVVEPLTARLGA